jgi:hypothetical protein
VRADSVGPSEKRELNKPGAAGRGGATSRTMGISGGSRGSRRVRGRGRRLRGSMARDDDGGRDTQMGPMTSESPGEADFAMEPCALKCG